jgi:hypothetical protein
MHLVKWPVLNGHIPEERLDAEFHSLLTAVREKGCMGEGSDCFCRRQKELYAFILDTLH